jgi:hypothetical protein
MKRKQRRRVPEEQAPRQIEHKEKQGIKADAGL